MREADNYSWSIFFSVVGAYEHQVWMISIVANFQNGFEEQNYTLIDNTFNQG